MSEQQKHTPMPWRLTEFGGDIYILPPEGSLEPCVTSISLDSSGIKAPERNRANAALIVRAVNRDHAFEAMVEAAKALLSGIDEQFGFEPHDSLNRGISLAHAALALAGQGIVRPEK